MLKRRATSRVSLDVRDLILTDGDEVGLIEEDVGGLEERVAEEAVGGQVLLAELLLLVFVGGDAFEPAERGEHAEERVEFEVLGDVRLDEDGAERSGSRPAARKSRATSRMFSRRVVGSA